MQVGRTAQMDGSELQRPFAREKAKAKKKLSKVVKSPI